MYGLEERSTNPQRRGFNRNMAGDKKGQNPASVIQRDLLKFLDQILKNVRLF